MLDPKDGGFKSRKMIMAYACMAYVAGGAIACAIWSVLVPLYATFVGGILGSAALYMTGNVAAKSVINSSPAADKEEQL